MRRLIVLVIVIGMLIGAGGCKKEEIEPCETYNDTPDSLATDKYGIIWKVGYIPCKAIHELFSGVLYGICGKEPVEKGDND